MGNVECFFLRPVAQANESLRRYSDAKCPTDMGYHNASVDLGVVPYELNEWMGSGGDNLSHDDPRWPKVCPCGYVFQPEDHWQHNLTRLLTSDSGLLTTLDAAPVGAMWYANWYPVPWLGPDGKCLVVKTPGGDWIVDGPSSNGGTPWTRTGTVPKVTASPSIHFPGRYHGWLRDGILTEC